MNRKRALCLLMVIAGVLLIAGSVWGAAGEQLWEKKFNFLPQYNSIQVSGMATSSTSLIVYGFARNDSTGIGMGFIKAFDVDSGNIKWEDTLSVGATGNSFTGLALYGEIALVRGGGSSLSGNPPVYTFNRNILRAYHADTGQQLWEIAKDWEKTPSEQVAGPPNIVAANNRVFNILDEIDTSGKWTGICTVRAYQVKNVGIEPTMLLLD